MYGLLGNIAIAVLIASIEYYYLLEVKNRLARVFIAAIAAPYVRQKEFIAWRFYLGYMAWSDDRYVGIITIRVSRCALGWNCRHVWILLCCRLHILVFYCQNR